MARTYALLLKAEASAIQSSTSKAYVLSLPASRLTVEVADLVVVVAIPTLEVTLVVEVMPVSGAADVKVELDVVRELVKLELELEAMNVTFKRNRDEYLERDVHGLQFQF